MRNVTLGYIIGAIQATLAVAVLFGLPLSEDQMAGVVAAVSAWGLVWLALNDRKPSP